VCACSLQGALVANYPWDGTADKGTHYSRCPDDEAFAHLARVYSQAHALMHGSREFKGGITNGANWYPLWGGMQVAHSTT
jgi:carboxypeptidase D